MTSTNPERRYLGQTHEPMDDSRDNPECPESKCPVAIGLMAPRDEHTGSSSPAQDVHGLYDNTSGPMFPERGRESKLQDSDVGESQGPDIDHGEPEYNPDYINDRSIPSPVRTSPPPPIRDTGIGIPSDQPQNFTQGAAQKAAQAAGVGAAYTINAATIGAREGIKAAKKAGEHASKYRLLSQQFWTTPIGGVDDGPEELMELDETGPSGSVDDEKDEGARGGDVGDDVDRMMGTCEKVKEYDGNLRTRLLGGVCQYLTDTAMLFALSSSLTLNTIFSPLERQSRAYRGGIAQNLSPIVEVEFTPNSETIFTQSPAMPAVDLGTAEQAKWIKLLLIDSMVLSIIALFIGYSAMGIVRAFNPWGWMGSEASRGSPSNESNEHQGFKADFNDPSHAAQTSSLSQKLQLQARRTQFEALKTRLPLVYLFARIYQAALLFFVCGFLSLMYFVWTNEVGFFRFFKGVLGSSAVLPLLAMGVVTVLSRARAVAA